MAKTTAKKPGRPKGTPKKAIYIRVAPVTLEALDEICKTIKPQPSRANLIDMALAEWVEQRQKQAETPG